MDALVMCGGRGSRLDRGEKPLVAVDGVPMVDRVIDAVTASGFDTVAAVTSPHAPDTAAHLDGRVPLVETDGDGYVADLTDAIDRVGTPVVTVAADVPLLAPGPLDRLREAYEGPSVTLCVPSALKRHLGVSVDTERDHEGVAVAPTGVNVVGADDAETIRVSHDARLAVNVNRPDDLAIADRLAAGLPREVSSGGPR